MVLAVQQAFGLVPSVDVSRPLRVAVVEVPIAHSVKRLRYLSSDPRPSDRELERQLIAVKLRQAQEEAKAGMLDALKAEGHFVILKDTTTEALAESLDLAYGDETIPADIRTRFREASNADAIVRFRISDYGRTPRKVLKWIYIGTTAWIAGIITFAATNPQTRPYIGAYIGTEVLQEGAELYLGTSFFGHEYKPARVEAELIDLKTGAILWQDAKTRTASNQFLKIYPKDQRSRELELAISVDRATLDLAKSLAKKF